jgi:hypothetical protein
VVCRDFAVFRIVKPGHAQHQLTGQLLVILIVKDVVAHQHGRQTIDKSGQVEKAGRTTRRNGADEDRFFKKAQGGGHATSRERRG